MTGSRELTIYLAPNKRLKGYVELRAFVEAQGCRMGQVEGDRLLPGKGYTAVRITCREGLIPEEVLRRAHRWAHRRNYLHRFFKPLPGARDRSGLRQKVQGVPYTHRRGKVPLRSQGPPAGAGRAI